MSYWLTEREVKKKLNEKTIIIKITNGKLVEAMFESHGDDGEIRHDYELPFNLKEIAIVTEALKKEQEKIMNRLKDEAQKEYAQFSTKLKVDEIELSNGVKILPERNGIRIEQKDGHVLFTNTQPLVGI